MNHEIDASHSHLQAFGVAHITDKISDIRVFAFREAQRHFMLLKFVPRENNDLFGLRGREDLFEKRAPERPGAPGNEDCFTVQIKVWFFESVDRCLAQDRILQIRRSSAEFPIAKMFWRDG